MSIFKACVSGRSKKASVMYSTSDSMVRTDRTSKEDPNMAEWKAREEMKSPGEGEEENRIVFWNSGLSVCIKCGKKNLQSEEVRAGVRSNGEAYGTDVFRCQTEGCGWNVSYLFDDASEDCWHYEAMGWPRSIRNYPLSYMELWAEKHKLPTSVKAKIKDLKITGSQVLEMLNKENIEGGLSISKKDADKVRKALGKEYGPLLT